MDKDLKLQARGGRKGKMVLSEFSEAGAIVLAVKQQYEKEITVLREQLRQSQEQHLSDLTNVLRLCFLLEESKAGVFIFVVQHWSMYPDPRPVLEDCFSTRPPTEEWLRRLRGVITILLYPPQGSEQQKEFVKRAEEALDAAAATIH